MTTPVLHTEQLSIAFESGDSMTLAVDALDLALMPGKTTVLLGESGSGKSLTARALMRLLPDYAVYGDQSVVDFQQRDLLALPEYMMRALRGKKISLIFQEPMTALNPVLTIGQQLSEAFLHEKLSPRARRARLHTLLREVEISDPVLRLQQYPHQLSGGQKQRVMIAMAIANHPDVLIADEPTTALDVTIQAQILDLLKRLQHEYQMSMLLITHNLGVVRTMADQVFVMYAGEIVEVSTVEAFFTKPLHPYSQYLLQAMPSMSKRGSHLTVMRGQVPTLGAWPLGCRFNPRCEYAFSPCLIEKPILQTIPDEGTVRCHLYHASLPGGLPPRVDALPSNTIEHVTSDDGVLLEASAVSVHFGTSEASILGVDEVSFTLKKGHTLAIVGESGSGKSTLCRALVGLLPLTHGSVHYEGQAMLAVNKRPVKHLLQQIQMIFQDPYSAMNPRMTVREILDEGMQWQGYSKSIQHQKQLELLDQVHLSANSLNRYPHQFSGGQRQRIGIARALAANPKILICDEPTSALDVSIQAQILNLLQHLQVTYRLTYLFVTHDLSVVSYMASEVLVMHQGRVVEAGPCEAIFAAPQSAYTRILLDSVLLR